eukprot:3628606-Rhodomonas_salina.3
MRTGGSFGRAGDGQTLVMGRAVVGGGGGETGGGGGVLAWDASDRSAVRSTCSEAQQTLLDLDALVGWKAAENYHGRCCLWRTCHALAQPDAVRDASDSVEEHRCQLYIVVEGLVAVHHGGRQIVRGTMRRAQ